MSFIYYLMTRKSAFILGFLFFLNLSFCSGQKRPIDLHALGNWPMAGMCKISSDGQYVFYYVNKITGNRISSSYLILKSLTCNWQVEIPNAVYSAEFLSDNQHIVIPLKGATILLIKLGTSEEQRIPYIQSFKIMDNWLAFHHKGNEHVLRLRDERKSVETNFLSVISYQFDPASNSLLLQQKEGDSLETVQWIDLSNMRRKTIWKGSHFGVYLFNAKGTQLAFTTNIANRNELWLYKKGDNYSKRISLDSSSEELSYTLQNFSQDGKRLLINVAEMMAQETVKSEARPGHIWKSTDVKLLSQQEREGRTEQNYAGVVDLETGTLIMLQKSMERVISSSDNYLLLSRRQGEADLLERNWNPAFKQKLFLVSTKDGSRKVLPFEEFPYLLSPEGKYVLQYDAAQGNYLCYDIAKDKVYNLTKNTTTTWTYSSDYADSAYAVNTLVIKWLKGDRGVIINDRYDLWLFDLWGQYSQVNITNGFGRRNGIHFQICLSTVEQIIEKKQRLLLSAFNPDTKENGFFAKVLGEEGDPVRLSMGPYIYYTPYESISDDVMMPIKAKKAEAYIVKRMYAATSPNYFYTKDFVSFTSISNIIPEENYNWLQVDLVGWKGLDGSNLQGVLYKPENFNPSLSYPVIIYYYERLSNNLHVYQSPQLVTGTINIPYLVSNGYLVFTPDIHQKIGYPGESAMNSVVSAGNYLKRLEYVDSTKIGIQGHSFGGFETNYIVTHTTMCCRLFCCGLLELNQPLWKSERRQCKHARKNRDRPISDRWKSMGQAGFIYS